MDRLQEMFDRASQQTDGCEQTVGFVEFLQVMRASARSQNVARYKQIVRGVFSCSGTMLSPLFKDTNINCLDLCWDSATPRYRACLQACSCPARLDIRKSRWSICMSFSLKPINISSI